MVIKVFGVDNSEDVEIKMGILGILMWKGGSSDVRESERRGFQDTQDVYAGHD